MIPPSWPLLAAGRVSRNLVTIHKPIPVDRAIRASGVFGVLTLGAIWFGKERETQYRVARTHKGRKDERQKEGGPLQRPTGHRLEILALCWCSGKVSRFSPYSILWMTLNHATLCPPVPYAGYIAELPLRATHHAALRRPWTLRDRLHSVIAWTGPPACFHSSFCMGKIRLEVSYGFYFIFPNIVV